MVARHNASSELSQEKHCWNAELASGQWEQVIPWGYATLVACPRRMCMKARKKRVTLLLLCGHCSAHHLWIVVGDKITWGTYMSIFVLAIGYPHLNFSSTLWAKFCNLPGLHNLILHNFPLTVTHHERQIQAQPSISHMHKISCNLYSSMQFHIGHDKQRLKQDCYSVTREYLSSIICKFGQCILFKFHTPQLIKLVLKSVKNHKRTTRSLDIGQWIWSTSPNSMWFSIRRPWLHLLALETSCMRKWLHFLAFLHTMKPFHRLSWEQE